MLHTRTTFHLNHVPPTATFTSTGPGSVCRSGTLSDQPVAQTPNGLILNETFYCAHSQRDFEIRSHLHFARVAADGTQTVVSSWRALNLGESRQGSGHGHGVLTGCTPVGDTQAACLKATGILTGRLNGQSGT